MLRRLADITVSALLLALLSPVLILAALAVRLDSRGPALFRQTRVGKGGLPFTMFKFRSMRVEAGHSPVTMGGRRDRRVTRVGAFLRDSKIDELPQLFNVLRGEMTLIGPRAETPNFVESFTPHQREVLEVKPGLTGPGQILYTTTQAARLEGAADPNRYYIEKILPEKLEQDLLYLRTRSLRGDLAILGRTLLVMMTLGRRG
ncbi:MAG TPA: sugar transferase [Candidatus Polarisedimenticolia bacterium]|jgi:lipopolysaccharide/colanic/teichoic acid biosynthesis glycosyltransferase